MLLAGVILTALCLFFDEPLAAGIILLGNILSLLAFAHLLSTRRLSISVSYALLSLLFLPFLLTLIGPILIVMYIGLASGMMFMTLSFPVRDRDRVHMLLQEEQQLNRLPPRHGRNLEFRIGICSGPLIAGVIGETKFHYDLWGHTVNVASRMESHGEEGIIQITRET